MTRRRFVYGLAVAAAGMLGSAWWVWRPSRWAADRLRAHFAYLDIDPEAIQAYIDDYQRYRGRLRDEAWPARVHTDFLMSTDFFERGRDEARRIQYVTFYDPARVPCFNPFAEFDSD